MSKKSWIIVFCRFKTFRPYIHRLFPCGIVTRITRSDLDQTIDGGIVEVVWSSPPPSSDLVTIPQQNMSQGNSVWIQGLRQPANLSGSSCMLLQEVSYFSFFWASWSERELWEGHIQVTVNYAKVIYKITLYYVKVMFNNKKSYLLIYYG